MSLGLSQTWGLCQASNASTQREKYTINISYSLLINLLIHIHSLLILSEVKWCWAEGEETTEFQPPWLGVWEQRWRRKRGWKDILWLLPPYGGDRGLWGQPAPVLSLALRVTLVQTFNLPKSHWLPVKRGDKLCAWTCWENEDRTLRLTVVLGSQNGCPSRVAGEVPSLVMRQDKWALQNREGVSQFPQKASPSGALGVGD